jgi:hypothetical protein
VLRSWAYTDECLACGRQTSNHGWHGDAPLEIAVDGMVLGRALDGDAFQRHVGASVRSTARHDLQDRLIADAEAAAVDGRSGARAA